LSRAVTLTALLPFTLAFKDTVPVVAWSSHSSDRLDSLASRPTPFVDTSRFFDALIQESDLCQYDAVIIAEQPGLHASDLRTLSKSSYISSRLNGATSSLQVPYLPHAESDSFDEFKRTLAERCGSRRVEIGLGQGGVGLQGGEKHVVCVSMPHLEGENRDRKGAMRKHEAQLSNDISNFASVFPSHLVIYLGSRPFTKRQAITTHTDPDSPTRPVISSGSDIPVGFAPVNTTLPEGNLFQRYRFFTPGLITALLIVFGLLVPVLMVGIYALASIQSPLRMDAPKGPSLDKKNQ